MQTEIMQSNLDYLGWVFFGVVIALALRGIGSRLAESREEFREAAYDLGTLVALRIILPIHVLLTTAIVNHDKLGKLVAMPVLGGMVCLLVFLFSKLMQLLPAIEGTYPQSPYLASTFGGGNRGVMMMFAIVTFAPAFVPEEDLITLVDRFALLDAGYFLFFLIAIRPFLRLGVFTKGSDDENKKSHIWEWGPILACGVVGVVFNLVGKEALEGAIGSDALGYTLQSVRVWVSYAMVFVATTMIVFVITFRFTLENLVKLFVVIIVARLLSFLIVTAVIVATLVAFDAAPAALDPVMLLPLVILTLCPPSSLADKMLRQDGADIETVELAATLSGVWNFFFVLVAFFLFGLAAMK